MMLNVPISQSKTSKTYRTITTSEDTGMETGSNSHGLFSRVTPNSGWVRCNMGDYRQVN
jgi:hypothetical protein